MTRRRRREERLAVLDPAAVKEKLVNWRAEQDRICDLLYRRWSAATQLAEKAQLPYTVALDPDQGIPVALLDEHGQVMTLLDRGPRGSIRCRWVRSAVTLGKMRELASKLA